MKHVLSFSTLLIAISFGFLAFRWIEENYASRLEPIQPVGPFHNPGYRQTAEDAENEYAKLSAAKREEVRKNLEQSIVSMERWIDWIRESRITVLCLGEDHEHATRQFLARTLFSEIDIDILLLEVTPHQLGLITQELRWDRKQVLLLDADIAEIIRAARRRNPDVQLIGIEETKRQRIARQKGENPGSRDESISNNFWHHFRYGRVHAILFGALHCTNRKHWLYGRIRGLAPRRVASDMINIRIMEEHQDGRVEAFVHFLSLIGVNREDFIVIDSEKLHPLIYEWFESLGVTLKEFSALIVFGNDSGKRKS